MKEILYMAILAPHFHPFTPYLYNCVVSCHGSIIRSRLMLMLYTSLGVSGMEGSLVMECWRVTIQAIQSIRYCAKKPSEQCGLKFQACLKVGDILKRTHANCIWLNLKKNHFPGFVWPLVLWLLEFIIPADLSISVADTSLHSFLVGFQSLKGAPRLLILKFEWYFPAVFASQLKYLQ